MGMRVVDSWEIAQFPTPPFSTDFDTGHGKTCLQDVCAVAMLCHCAIPDAMPPLFLEHSSDLTTRDAGQWYCMFYVCCVSHDHGGLHACSFAHGNAASLGTTPASLLAFDVFPLVVCYGTGRNLMTHTQTANGARGIHSPVSLY